MIRHKCCTPYLYNPISQQSHLTATPHPCNLTSLQPHFPSIALGNDAFGLLCGTKIVLEYEHVSIISNIKYLSILGSSKKVYQVKKKLQEKMKMILQNDQNSGLIQKQYCVSFCKKLDSKFGFLLQIWHH